MSSHERRQGLYWILTIPWHAFTVYLPPRVEYLRGQLERGDSGYLHWQLLAVFSCKQSLRFVRHTFGEYHAELTRSSAADAYVWKDDTYIDGTRFELGDRKLKRNSSNDWDQIWQSAVAGDFDSIPADVRVRYFFPLRAIRSDNAVPTAIVKHVQVYWGVTGVGKSRLAWEEAGLSAYPKDPRSKFWCGYRGQEHVVIDEFRGGIDISHLLRWLDRYPLSVELKGSSTPLCVSKFWITSNLHPSKWYPDLDQESYDALARRLTIKELIKFP